MLKILYVTNNTGFCRFYRCQFPAQYMSMSGEAQVQFIDPVDINLLNKTCKWADIIVFQHGVAAQYIIALSKLIKNLKLPQLIVVEYDDNLIESHPMNVGAYFYWGTQEIYGKNGNAIWKDGMSKFSIAANMERIQTMIEANKQADLITVTTPQLAEAFNYVKDKVEAIPNFINPSVMPIRNDLVYSSNVTKIIWQGGDSHYADLALMMPALKKIKDIWGDKVEFYLWGISYRSLGQNIGAKFIPWSTPELFFPHFSEHHFDIGIIPIEDNKFNHGKSNIKWLEYSYYSIPSVVQNNFPYKQHIEDYETGLLFDTQQDFFDGINTLIKDPILRMKIAANARAKVLKDYNIETKYHLWLECYKKHLKKKIASYT